MNTVEPKRASSGQRVLDILIILIVALMPFHAFLSVSLGHVLGHQTLIQSWKEVTLVLAGLLVIALYEPAQIIATLKRKVNLAIITFAVLALLISLAAGAYHGSAFWYGVKTDLGFLLAFILAQFASARAQKWAVIVFMAASTIVGLFGFVQVNFLPVDFLNRFGYGPNTIEAFRFVNPAVPAVRIVSTLSGPNQLGSFLILPICLMVYQLISRRRWIWLIPLGLCLYTLWHTYSRSAELGLVVAIVVMLFALMNRKWRLIAAGTLLAIALIVGFLGRNAIMSNETVQAYVFHGAIIDQKVYGSDAGRLAGIQDGISTVAKQPLGRGLGTAGPASYHGANTIITEDYYLQIAIEAGILGLLVFGLIVTLAGTELWRVRDEALSGFPILAALAGLSICNLFLHTWADSSTALTFWVIAGLAINMHRHEVV